MSKAQRLENLFIFCIFYIVKWKLFGQMEGARGHRSHSLSLCGGKCPLAPLRTYDYHYCCQNFSVESRGYIRMYSRLSTYFIRVSATKMHYVVILVMKVFCCILFCADFFIFTCSKLFNFYISYIFDNTKSTQLTKNTNFTMNMKRHIKKRNDKMFF